MLSNEMQERVERAVSLFKSGYNCSQSVVAAFADLYGVEEQQALRMSASFGGGIGRMRQTCGAACGMFMLAGLDCGTTDPKDREAKSHTPPPRSHPPATAPSPPAGSSPATSPDAPNRKAHRKQKHALRNTIKSALAPSWSKPQQDSLRNTLKTKNSKFPQNVSSMRILLLGEFSNVHATLALGLRKLGQDVGGACGGDVWMGGPRDSELKRGLAAGGVSDASCGRTILVTLICIAPRSRNGIRCAIFYA